MVSEATAVDVVTGEILPVTYRADLLTAPPVAEVQALQAQYVELCHGLLAPEDFQSIGQSSFKKKSAWRKLAVAFNVSTDVLDERETRDDAGRIIRARFHVNATAPNGRHWDGIGICDRWERCCLPGCDKSHRHCAGASGGDCLGYIHFSNAEHDIPATAHTRAANRACADLFGLGEVSAEEVSDRAPTGATGAGASAQRAGRGSGRRAAGVERAPAPPPPAPTDAPAIEGTAELAAHVNALAPDALQAYRAAIRARGLAMPPSSPEALAGMASELAAIEQIAAEERDTYGGGQQPTSEAPAEAPAGQG